MKRKSLKEKIEEDLMALDFDTQRMSESGNIAYRELRNIVIDLYNDNLELKEKLKQNEEILKKQEEKQIWVLKLLKELH